MSALVSGEDELQFILRLLNTNVDGKQKIMYALTQIKGVGRRYSTWSARRPMSTSPSVLVSSPPKSSSVSVHHPQTPTQYKIPSLFQLPGQQDREDLERLKKIRSHRGLRHYWGLRVRGQHTKTTGRRGRTVGVSKKKG
ncbi:hypothetical protein N7499_007665 [Penicillium canescens]|nr:hypothetical protein N7499_007665 [Penicillium canescens]